MLERAPIGTSYKRTFEILKDKGFEVSNRYESRTPPRDCRVWLYDGPVKRTFIALVAFSVKVKIVVFHFDENDSLRGLSMTTRWEGP